MIIKDSKNYKKYVLNFFLVVKAPYNKCYIIYKITEDSVENGNTFGPDIAKDGGLENLFHYAFEKHKSSGEWLLSRDFSSNIYGESSIRMLKDTDNNCTKAFNCAVGKLADIIVDELKDKLDDSKINVAYKDLEKLKNAMKNRIFEGLGDSQDKLVFTSNPKKSEIDKFKQLGWSVIKLN